MSSILDALKKLEEEKGLDNALEGGPEFSAEWMPPDLAHGGGLAPETWTLQLGPGRIMMIVGGFAVALSLVSILATYVLLRPGTESETSAVAAARQEPAPSVSAPSAMAMIDEEDLVPKPASREEATPTVASSEPEPIVEASTDLHVEVEAIPATAVETTEKSTVLAAAAPRPPAPVARNKARETVAEANETPTTEAPRLEPPVRAARLPDTGRPSVPARSAPRPSTRASQPSRPLPPPTAKMPASIKDLPRLSASARMKHGLEDLELNMLNIKEKGAKNTNALINYLPIFEGEIILKTGAKLIKIESHGIAIEILSTADRYYIPY